MAKLMVCHLPTQTLEMPSYNFFFSFVLKDQEEMEGIHGRTVQKDLNELDNYDGVVSQPEPDILEA